MNAKKNLQNRIQGWFPSTPTIPSHTRPLIVQNTQTPAPPIPPPLENKLQRNIGIIIGLGIGVLLLGSAGAFFTSRTIMRLRVSSVTLE